MKKIIHCSFVFALAFILTGCGSDVAQAPMTDTPPIQREVVDTDVSPSVNEELADLDLGDILPDGASDLQTPQEIIAASGVVPVALLDVANGNASGEAWTAFGPDQKTYHRVEASNMPTLNGTDFYEGWIVRNAATGDFISTGKMIPGELAGQFTLEYTVDGDFTDYKKVVITLEPDDGDPAPAAHIIEN